MRDFLAIPSQKPPVLSRVPRWLAWFLGYRDDTLKSLKAPEWLKLLNVLVSTYAALLIQAAINKYAYPFKGWATPPLVPSFGASAILCFNAVGSPLAQPRNLIVGSIVGSFVGVVLLKFWLEHASNEQYLWLGAPLACAITSVLASILQCVHPPIGATAMLPLLDSQIADMGWKYLVVVMQGCAIFLVMACIFDNLTAQYPTAWWTPAPATPAPPAPSPLKVEITLTEFKSSIELDAETKDLIAQLQTRLSRL